MPVSSKMVNKGNGMFKKEHTFEEEQPKNKLALRSEEVYNLTVEVGGLNFYADETSMDRMDRVVDLANWKFNKAQSMGLSAADAYQQVYGILIPWKTVEGLQQVSVETICVVQDTAVQKLGEIWVKYG